MKKHYLNFPRFSLALSLGLAMSTTIPAVASIKDTTLSLGVPTGSGNLLALDGSRIGFKVRGIRPSQKREGGLVRGNCAGQEMYVTALLPKTNEKALKIDQVEIESTVSPRPTFLVHMTQPPVKNAEFMVQKQNGEDVFAEKIALTGNAGILSMTLPASSKPLEVGQLYHWSFSVVCDPNDNSANIVVDGWVKRIEPAPTLAAQLQIASPIDRAALYAQAEIWTDALSTLAELRKAKPNDPQVAEDWTSLLESVNLNTLAQATIIGSINGTTGQ